MVRGHLGLCRFKISSGEACMITRILPQVRSLVLGLGIAGGVVVPSAWAQGPPPLRVRGTIERIDGETLQVKTRGGADAPLRLAKDLPVAGLTKASWDDIKPGSYVGTAAIEQGSGHAKSLEVQVFPENLRG